MVVIGDSGGFEASRRDEANGYDFTSLVGRWYGDWNVSFVNEDTHPPMCPHEC